MHHPLMNVYERYLMFMKVFKRFIIGKYRLLKFLQVNVYLIQLLGRVIYQHYILCHSASYFDSGTFDSIVLRTCFITLPRLLAAALASPRSPRRARLAALAV